MFDDALADFWLLNAADIDFTGDGRNFNLDMHGHVAVGQDSRSDVNVDADVLILKLRVHEWADHGTARSAKSGADSGLETASGDGNAVANFQAGLLSVNRADFRILQNSSVVGAEQRGDCGARQVDVVVGGGKVLEHVQGDHRSRRGGCG